MDNRILVADDAPSVNLLVRKALEGAGYDVVAVSNGTAAYEEGATGAYQLAVIDHFMPGMLGIDILQRWREQGIDMPVLVLSGLDDDHTVVQSLELGAADFIRKPFNVRELVVRVRSHLSRQTTSP
jgi:DNA-binding response OmpR family regulator